MPKSNKAKRGRIAVTKAILMNEFVDSTRPCQLAESNKQEIVRLISYLNETVGRLQERIALLEKNNKRAQVSTDPVSVTDVGCTFDLYKGLESSDEEDQNQQIASKIKTIPNKTQRNTATNHGNQTNE